jgi:hypothetical protein
MLIILAVGVLFGCCFILVTFVIYDPIHWSYRGQCPITNRVVMTFSDGLPCPCHGEILRRVMARWRFGWEIKESTPEKEKP